MKVHKMSTKQFAKFVSGLQEQAWEIRRRLGGALWYTLWVFHNKERHAWTVYEGDKVYEYLDSDLEKGGAKWLSYT